MRNQRKTSAKNNFVTKGHFDKKVKTLDDKVTYLGNKVDSLDKRLEDSILNANKRFDRVLDYVDKRFTNLENILKRHETLFQSISKTLDWLVAKFKKLDEEHIIMTHRYPEIREELDNHEGRIQVLEKG